MRKRASDKTKRISRKIILGTPTGNLTKVSIEIIRHLALNPDVTRYSMSPPLRAFGSKKGKKRGLGFEESTVYLNVKKLEEWGFIKTTEEEEYRGHIRKLYRLRFYGLLTSFDSKILETKGEITKAIENYEYLHPLFSHWKKLEKSVSFNPKIETKNGKSFPDIYDVLRIASYNAVNGTSFQILVGAGAYRLSSRFMHKFDYVPSDLVQYAEWSFAIDFFRWLIFLGADIEKGVESFYPYMRNVVNAFKEEFKLLEETINKLCAQKGL